MEIKRQITVAGQSYWANVPDQCPICHRHSEVMFIKADLVNQHKGAQVVLQCAFAGCRSYFICYYGKPPAGEVLATKPIKPDSTAFPDTVKELSPTFIDIYSEADEAAQLRLSQIAGPGYRKAFEFLIKDYAKSLAPDKVGDIEKMFSGKVVDDFVADARIQAVAKRCLWLGNDETHYLRKWTDHDMADLKTLIRLCVSWIEIDRLSKSYVSSMPEAQP